MKKLSMSNNPVVNKKRRYWMLENRKRKLSALARPATIEYDDDGMAARLYPNYCEEHRRARKMVSRIREEQREIAKWIHGHGYNLA